MSILISETPAQAPGVFGAPPLSRDTGADALPKAWRHSLVRPGALARCAFYLSIFSIPFSRVYLPGTGGRFGVVRIVQLLLVAAALSQPRICLRWVPVALLWFFAYCGWRIGCGLWLSPEWSGTWWPATFEWIQFSLPWAWVIFNLLQFPGMRRRALWALVWGCALCAALHLSGIGVAGVEHSTEGRTSIFGENANVVGAAYAAALIALVGVAMFKGTPWRRRGLCLLLIALIGAGLAKTGSRTAALLVVMGVGVLMFQADGFSSRARRYWTLLLIGAVLAVVVWQVPTVMKRFEKVNSSNLEQQEGRVRMMPVLWEMFLRSPVYGSGPDQYQFELTRRAMPYLIRDQRTIAAHNLMLMLLVETGMIGFLVFSTGLGKALASAWKGRRFSCGSLPLALLLPFVISAMVVSNPAPQHIFWFAVAYALAAAPRSPAYV